MKQIGYIADKMTIDGKKMFANYKVEDSPIPVSKHLELLSKAGFKNVDVIWKKCNFAVYGAIK